MRYIQGSAFLGNGVSAQTAYAVCDYGIKKDDPSLKYFVDPQWSDYDGESSYCYYGGNNYGEGSCAQASQSSTSNLSYRFSPCINSTSAAISIPSNSPTQQPAG
jgi:hypothetical protein